MKKKDSSSSSTNVNQGWKQADQWFLNRHDNKHEPELQILTEEDWENGDKEQRDYFCAICKSKLDFLKDTETIWICSNCSQVYDTKIQDAPIKDMSESKVRTYTELSHYPTYEENDIYMPFVQGIDPDADAGDIPSNIEVVSDDGRHKHIRVKGLPTEALATMNEMDGRT